MKIDSDPDDLALAEAIGARLCHDLTGPVSAIMNGVEIAVEGGQDASVAMALVERSADTAAARLRFLRLAFGPPVTLNAMSMMEFGGIAVSYFAASRASLEWPQQVAEPPGGTKLAALILLLADEAVPLGGTVRVTSTIGNLSIVAQGRNGGLRPEVVAALEGRWTAGSTRAAPAYLAYRLSRLVDVAFGHRSTSDGVEFMVQSVSSS